MAGYLRIWGKSIKRFDRHIRSCLPLTRQTQKSLTKINADFLGLHSQNETLAKYVAKKAGFEYGVGFEHEDPAMIPIKTIIKGIGGRRHLMPRDEVNSYRKQIQSIIEHENRTLAELDALARTTRATLDRLRKIDRFFRYTERQEQDARRKVRQSASVNRATKSRRRK